MKRCIHCSKTKPLSEFYKHPMMADGHLGACKECHKERARANRWKKVDDKREYDRRRYAESAERRAALAERSAEKAKQPGMEEYRRAHRMVAYHVRVGHMTKQPCQICGAAKVVAHHDDYRKPLDVMWLCQPCHTGRHAVLDAAGHDYHHGG